MGKKRNGKKRRERRARDRARKLQPWQYREYIQSDAWKAKREKFLSSNLPQAKICCGCKTPRRAGFHVHHRTYNRLGFELIQTDLVLACPECHEKIHDIQKRSGISVWRATRAINWPQNRIDALFTA